MPITTIRRLLPFFLCILVIASTHACQMINRTPPEEAVRTRINEFMNAKINKDWAKAYTYFDSDYHDRVQQYQFASKMSKMEFTGFTVDSIEVNPAGDRAEAVVKTDVNMQGFDFKGSPETQIWVRDGGKWVLHAPPKDPKSFFK